MLPVEQRLRDDADRVGEVHDPGVRRGARPREIRQLEDDGNGAQGLREAARTGGFLPDVAEARRNRLVEQTCSLAADPQLDDDEVGAVQGRIAVERGRQETAPAAPLEDPSGKAADDPQPFRIDIQEDEFLHRQAVLPGDEPFDQLRGVRAATADHGDLEAH